MSYKLGESGSVLVMALLILVVLTILGVTIARTTNLDLRIITNDLFRKRSFYVAEGGVHREGAEVGKGNYVVIDVNDTNRTLANQTGVYNFLTASFDIALPTPAHQVHNNGYDFTVTYRGVFLPPKGYSVTHFSRYDYDFSLAILLSIMALVFIGEFFSNWVRGLLR